MRKFTKKHNDLQWLFPFAKTEKEAKEIFNDCEEQAEYLFEHAGYDAKDKDLAIDCYMKGCSCTMQLYMDMIRDRTVHDLYNNIVNAKNDKDKNHGRFGHLYLLLQALSYPRSWLHLTRWEKAEREILKEMIENTGFDYKASHDIRMNHSIKVSEKAKKYKKD